MSGRLTTRDGCTTVVLKGTAASVRFLVAIDRRNGTEVAMETVKLAEEFMLSSDGLVVGLDLSGDPTVRTVRSVVSLFRVLCESVVLFPRPQVGDGRDLLPALQRAKNSGLKLSLHLSEVRAPTL